MRLFVATTFPESVLAGINERVARVRSMLPPASWVKPESQHLTFAFLGEQKPELVDHLAARLSGALARFPSFEAGLRGCGFFPNSRNPRVGWLGAVPPERFSALAATIRTAATGAGVQLDASDFRPHLTLCRIRDHWPPASIEVFQKNFSMFQSTPIRLDEVTLYASELRPTGAIHTVLRTFTLE